MDKLFLTQETVFEMYSMLNRVEAHLKDSEPHGELHTAVYDLLNEVEGERDSFIHPQS